jgi:hypothetical protein
MAKLIPFQDDFSLGMSQDTPREQLPKGKAWNIVDMIPELQAPLRKRGGWRRPWGAISATTATYVSGVAFAPFAAGSQVVFFDEDGVLYKAATSASSITSVGASRVPAHPPTFYRNRLFVCDVNGSSVPKIYDGSSVADLTTSPPNGALSCAYKDHLVLARSSANQNRVWFSDGGDYTGWNTAASGQWLDTTYPIQGLAALRNMIVVFGEGHTERIRGDIIPGVTGSNMVVEPLFSIGCSDPASVAVTDDYVVFANSAGVYLTDGVGVANLTLQGGIDQLWRTTLASYSSAYTIAGAVFRDKYHVVVMNDSTFVGSFVCDVKRRVWTQLTNVECPMLVSTPLGILDSPPALYGADRGSKYVMDLTTMYDPSSAYKNDGDGSPVTFTLETPHYMGKAGKKRWRHLYPKFYLSDSGNEMKNPSFETDTTYWTAFVASGSATLSRQSDTTFSAGSFAGQNAITGAAASDYTALYVSWEQRIPCTAGQTVTVSAKIKKTAGSMSDVKIAIRWIDSSDAFISRTTVETQSSPVNDTIYELEGSGAAPANTTWVGVEIGGTMSGASATYRVDDVSIVVSRDPTIAITASTDPSLSTYPITLSSLSENTSTERKRVRMAFASEGVQFKLVQSNGSGDTRILSLEADAHPMEQSRL